MVEVPEAYRTLTGSISSAAAISWRRSATRSRASAYSTAPRASATSPAGHLLRASADAITGGCCGFGLPDSRDHRVVVPPMDSSRCSILPARVAGAYRGIH
jgi:hypothetical protein